MNQITISITALVCGFLLDAFIGDPYHMPHPVRLFGNAISWGENWLNKGKLKTIKGAFLTLTLVVIVWLVLMFITKQLIHVPVILCVFTTIMVYYGLANRCLIDEVLKVEKQLSQHSIDAGRRQLSFIVGRETSKLSENQIRTAALETLSENLSDGVIAPLFYFALGGIPAMFAYKMINTLDSMIGYKNSRYKQFGMSAARLDDIVNFIPARITALLMILVSFNMRGLQFMFRFGNKHASPNSGYPESVLAGILDCRFGGPNTYHGQLVEKPYIGVNNRRITPKDMYKACVVNGAASVVMLLIIIAFQVFPS